MTDTPKAARRSTRRTPDVWMAHGWEDPSIRAATGKAARKRVPRMSHAAFEPAAGRDPIAILDKQETDRIQHLLPLRHARMAESAFAYYRGTPAVMAFDLAGTPRSDILVQASGDAHLSNFGLYASPERRLVFDANDFDETMPGPWEWDVKRLATSFVIAGQANGFDPAMIRKAAMASVRGYRRWMARYARMSLVDVWYAVISDDDIRDLLQQMPDIKGRMGAARLAALDAVFTKSRRKDGTRAFGSLTAVVDGRRVIVDDPPVLTHVVPEGGQGALDAIFTDYRASLPEHRRAFLERYRFVDFALKVVGVGSVGTRCFVLVLQGRDEDDPLILQAKEATASVLEPYLTPGVYSNHGQRVVVGQQLMQATSDVFLGWTRSRAKKDFFFRQLWDMKGSIDPATMQPSGLVAYAILCGWSLARAHARTGDPITISAYLGGSDRFDGAIADFAEAYALVNRRDHAAYKAAIADGTVSIPEA